MIFLLNQLQKLVQDSAEKGKALTKEQETTKLEMANTIRALEEELDQTNKEHAALRQELDDNLKGEIDKIVMEKDLERAKAEEDFASQVDEIRSHKDEVIQKLKEKLREKVEMNKKLAAECKMLGGRVKEQSNAYQLSLEEVCDNFVDSCVGKI